MANSSETRVPLIDSADQSDQISLSINENQSNNQSNNQAFYQSNDQSQYQSQYQTPNQSNNQSNVQYGQHQFEGQIHNQSNNQQFNQSFNQPINQPVYHLANPSNNPVFAQAGNEYRPLYETAPHLRHLLRERQLPPYSQPTSLRDLWSNYMSRGSKAFAIFLVGLMVLMLIYDSLRLVAVFLPILFIPAAAFSLFLVQKNLLQNVEVNLLLNQFIMGFSLIAIVTLIVETVLTLIFACVTLLPFQFEETKAWFKNQIDEAGNQSVNPEDMFQGFSRTVPFFLFIFLLSFCVAGCVEEGAKGWLGMRVKRITPGYRDKYGLIIYLIAGALGFSTFENIAYATAVTSPALSVFVNILTRAFISTPLHLCCSYLVGVGIVRREVFGHQIGWFRVFALPVFLHGSFDFALIVSSAVIDPESMLVIILDCVIVVVTFVLIAVVIFFERKHIEGEPDVLPFYDIQTGQLNSQSSYQQIEGRSSGMQLAAM